MDKEKVKKELQKLDLVELFYWHDEHWDEVSEDRPIDNLFWEIAKAKAEETFRGVGLLKLFELEDKLGEALTDDIFSMWDREIKSSYPLDGIFERLENIEKSVQLLLKEHENEPAKITIGQLNRLKGGI